MAPEQIEHPSDVDHRADIYALGVVFYQMLTGELPDKELQSPSKKVHIDVRLDEIVLKAMEINPEQRYQQASVMKTRVDGLRPSANIQAHSQSSHQTDGSAHGATGDARTDSFAITSFILGICSLILWPLTAVLAIVFGHISRFRMRKNDALTGNGLALAGLSLGYFFLIVFAFVTVAFFGPRSFHDASNDAYGEALDSQLRAADDTTRFEAADAEAHGNDQSLSEIEFIGEVRKTGRMPIQHESSLLDVVAAAGGWTANGDFQKIRITIPGSPESQTHDINAILNGDAVNPVIAPGSVIEIPVK